MDDDEKIKVYLKGYEEGQKEAWSDIESMVSKFEGWELKSRIESRIGTLYQEVESKREELKEDIDQLDFEEEESKGGEEEDTIEIPWKPGEGYLFIEDKLKEAIEVLGEVIESGVPILFIVRQSPDKIMDLFDDGSSIGDDCKFVWLSREDGVGEQPAAVEVERISPSDLPSLSQKIGKFLKNEEETVVLFSGIKLLTSYNEEDKILHLLHFTKDRIKDNDSCLVASISDKAVEEKFLEKFKDEFEEVYKI
ncbi:MAG: DUF835 domain-containing protein [Candidatus Thermoplasmatota archaeon]